MSGETGRRKISQAAVFLDRDGTLIEEIPYLHDPDRVKLVPKCIEALAELRRAGFKLVLISNQAGVARGFFAKADADKVNDAMATLLAAGAQRLDAMYYCPHHPNGAIKEFAIACLCRKPKPEMILRACEDLDLDPGRSYMIGNAEVDVGAGNAAGCTSLLISDTSELTTHADWIARDLLSAARWILDQK
jgi:D-glycero-D-manno-heptose 1,7-bisphosphate phosphatase